MAKGSNDVSRIICANTIKENKQRLLEARIKNQGKKTIRQDVSKLFNKLNQNAFAANTMKNTKLSCLSSYKRNVIKYWYGPIPEFPPGSWWGIRMDCSRDRVHDPFDIDRHEGPYGIISVCTSHSDINEDVDDGDFLTLTGQIYREEQPDADPFIRNYKNQIPLRLIRSYNLQNHIAPNTGYRYDGLYIIIGCWIGVSSNGIKYNKFALMRLAEQESPTWDSRNMEKKNCLSSGKKNDISSTQSNCKKSQQNSNAYNLRKCLFNTNIIDGKQKFKRRNNHENLLTAKTIQLIENKKPISESSIVTRHVSKKTSNVETRIPGTTLLPEQKTLCLGTSTPKTHSTNISIRMGLYESPYNVQDIKRNISTMLHKPVKPIDIANHTALDIDAHLLPKKNYDGTTNVNNTQNNSLLIENASCDVSRDTTNDNTEELVHPPHKRRRNLYYEDAQPLEPSYTISSSINNHNNNIDHPKLKEQLQNQAFLDTSIQNVIFNNEPEKDIVSVKHQEKANECFSVQDIKSLKSIDSLTPDKILNLINKKKHHPLSKLLIGNVIGLTFEECATLDTSKVISPDSKSKMCTLSKINHRKRKIKENVTCLSEDVLNRRYCKYSKSKRLSWKMMKHADIERHDKIIPGVNYQSRKHTTENHNNNVRIKARNSIPKENCLPPYHIQASFKAVTQYPHCTYNIKTRLRADKGGVLTKQEFSNSTVKKNGYKKRDREIANLLIDANFGPKRRGPRNRRLRCINSTYMNKRYCNTFNSIMYQSSKPNRITEKQQYKSNFKQKNKLTKINHKCAREKQSKDMYTMPRSLRTKRDNGNNKDIKNLKNVTKNNSNENCNYNNNNDNKNNKSKSTITSNCNIAKPSFKGRLRKQLVQAIPSQIPHYTSQVSSHLHYFHEQTAKPTTTDATTQCRLISEGTIENIRQKRMQEMKNKNSESSLFNKVNNRTTFIKMEWDKVKSEAVRNLMYNDRNSEIYETSRRFPIPAFTTNHTHRKDAEDYTDSSRFLCEQSVNNAEIREKYVNSVKDRPSAFVPVNVFDSDLRIARLRSIGFKPILKPQSPIDMEQTIESVQSNWKNTVASTSKTIKRDVAEEYEKYTNEDNNIVVYMDEELQYQDIEEEENENALGKEYNIKSRRDVPVKSELRNAESKHVSTSSKSISLNENLESPWHGWKKIITNNKSYWIGW